MVCKPIKTEISQTAIQAVCWGQNSFVVLTIYLKIHALFATVMQLSHNTNVLKCLIVNWH